ncbi:MAG: uracil-DNA glycosylase [Gammaproteobacteria bacterium]|nr:uracil-DNA glycosylase [Gammaproteobacteria bacterium]MDH3363774.1 uracil-DNA glycosylase [Gammaproteobacteria bacterium]MDH3481738.1 uracil-DNA glycosylase [Gammaproteobacteria bacterium]
MDAAVFDRNCRACTRLADFLDDVNGRYPDYYCGPVPPFGSADARFLIVGLAPGMHGANRTGRPFTGDHAGILLYQMLHKYGFSSRDHSESADDGLLLSDCRITNAVKCLPPDNKPVGAEINTCNRFLERELKLLPPGSVVMALGGIAHRAVIKARGLRQADYSFAHAAAHDLGEFTLLDSYHCSRYNTNTRRLTEAMFDGVFADVRALLQN